MRRKWVMGNWKMNGSFSMVNSIVGGLVQADLPEVECGIAPPALLLSNALSVSAGSDIVVGAQDVSAYEAGAYTGEISASMYHSLGLQYVLAGHSERRQYHHESNQLVARKAKQLLNQSLKPVVCIGETLEERESGLAQKVVSAQLKAVVDECGIEAFNHIIVAYEPVWAIGTGLAATSEQVQDIHAFLRTMLAKLDDKIALGVRIVYGGSIKPSNAQELFALKDVDGGLVGGASLNFEDFVAIIKAAG